MRTKRNIQDSIFCAARAPACSQHASLLSKFLPLICVTINATMTDSASFSHSSQFFQAKNRLLLLTGGSSKKTTPFWLEYHLLVAPFRIFLLSTEYLNTFFGFKYSIQHRLKNVPVLLPSDHPITHKNDKP